MALLVTAVVFASCTREPRNYEDCILQKIKPGMSDEAVGLVTMACRDKFPQPTPTPIQGLVDLPKDTISRLSGHFGPTHSGRLWSGNIYNATEDWTVRELTLVVGPQAKPKEDTFEHYMRQAREEKYRVEAEIGPLTSHDFTVDVNWSPTEEYEWNIVSARGIRTPRK